MLSGRADRARRVAAGILLLALAACGKKAPLRLPEQQPAERAAVPRAHVREGRVTLEFRVPRHRTFPEREEPWVLARILRRSGAAGAAVEVGSILEAAGFAFGASLSWVDQALAPGDYAYTVEFRDAARRRRAVGGPITVSWELIPGTPEKPAAAGGTRAIALTWGAPAGVDATTSYRVYRRDPGGEFEALTPEGIGESRHVDSRLEVGRTYCYAVRAVRTGSGLEVEGPASAEVCASAVAEAPAPERPPPAAP